MDNIALLIERIESSISLEFNLSTSDNIGLHFGKSGILLHLLFRYKRTQKEEDFEVLMNFLVATVDCVNGDDFVASNTQEVLGFAWVLNKIEKEVPGLELDQILTDFDVIAGKKLIDKTKDGDFDFLHGGFGILHYLISRNKILEFEGVIDSFLDRFFSSVQTSPRGSYVKTSKYLMSPEDAQYVNVNIGMAHGLASYVAILSLLYQGGFDQKRIESMTLSFISFILDSKLKNPEISLYPGSLVNFIPDVSGVSWCYGDLSVLIALHVANKTFDIDLDNEIHTILDFNSKRRSGSQTGGVIDPCFCHGYAGNAYIFYKFSKLYAHQGAYEASQFWLRKLEDYFSKSNGIVFYHELNSSQPSENDTFLDGSVGVLFVLKTIFEEYENSWDELFFLN